ncbi:MAG TPA: SOS response-associated peptidase, partial [Acidimicrobiales bacterium]|nr:SOS response-associated peptidase [Acidimicrobiales bacterium]
PPWAPDPSRAGRMINARSESAARAPAYRSALRSRRLVVPADGFFEWRTGPDGRRRPLLFERADGAPLHFAGLWERWWPEGRGGPSVRTLTIMTTAANPDMDGVHDRMPVVLEGDGLDDWLDDGPLGPPDLGRLLCPAPQGTLRHRPVDPRVGDVRNDFPELISPFDESGAGDEGRPEVLRLF